MLEQEHWQSVVSQDRIEIDPAVISKELNKLKHALMHEDEESIREVIHLFVKEISIGENEVHIAYRFSFPKKPTSGKSSKKCNPKKQFIRDLGQQPAFVDEPAASNEISDNKKNVDLVMVPKGGSDDDANVVYGILRIKLPRLSRGFKI
jgi:hypothetical protein